MPRNTGHNTTSLEISFKESAYSALEGLCDYAQYKSTFCLLTYLLKRIMQVNIVVLLTAGMSRDPTLSHVIPDQPSGRAVLVVTTLGDEVFILRAMRGEQQVEVYDAVSCTLKRHISVHGLPKSEYSAFGLAVCGHYKCLYVSACAWGHVKIHRVELTGSNAATNWSVTNHPKGLLVNRAHNVVVACQSPDKLQEYTTHGSLVRDICLQDGLRDPRYVVQLSTGDYVVSQKMLPGVVIVGEDGQVRHRCRQAPGVIQMMSPGSLAVTKNDEILVADPDNNRILSMNSSLSCVQELVLPVDGGIQVPCGLCLDETRGRLYVRDCNRGGGNCRVLVFNVDRFLNQQRLY